MEKKECSTRWNEHCESGINVFEHILNEIELLRARMQLLEERQDLLELYADELKEKVNV